ncbi:MAG: glycosyltransferase family 9 protein [Ignavibacteriales bacterium]|nr:glycosyltransferase family 9 protein [Ignavibacteriota bacterium]MCB9249772.1 glycosyltransferase family 9 protein [Ignavibacteriales bacterium]
MNLEKSNKILIIRLSSLGDILLTTPFVRSLKKQYPKLKIDFLLREQYKDSMLLNSNMNSLITIQKDYDVKETKEQLLKNNYDLVIDLQNNFRSRKISKGISNKIVRFKKPALNKFLLVKTKINLFREIIPIPVRYAATIPNFNLDEKGLEIFTDSEISPLFEKDKIYIGICPGSRHKTKMYPEEYFIELGNKLTETGKKIILFGGKDDIEVCEKISKLIPGSVNLSNNNEMLKTSANMKMCKAIICNDSGLMHLSLASNIPVIAIFGSTVRDFGFAPYKGKNLVLENNSLSCRPCSHIGLEDCPKKHFKCMLELSPQFVFQKTLEFINKA